MQVDTVSDHPDSVACSGLSLGTGRSNRSMVESGTPGTSDKSFTVKTEAIKVHAMFETNIVAPNQPWWPAGTWTFRFNVTGHAGLSARIRRVFICRVNSSGVNLATVGSKNVTIACSFGVKTVTVTGVETNGDADDRIYVVVGFDRIGGGNVVVKFRPNQNLDTPLTNDVKPMDAGSDTVQPAVGMGLPVTPADAATDFPVPQVNVTVPVAPMDAGTDVPTVDVEQGQFRSVPPMDAGTDFPAPGTAFDQFVSVSPMDAGTDTVQPVVDEAAGCYEALTAKVQDRFKTQIATPRSLQSQYDNVAEKFTGMWARVRVRHGETELIEQGVTLLYRKRGEMHVTVFAPLNEGVGDAMDHVDAIRAAFTSKNVDGVRYGDGGPDECPWIDSMGRIRIPGQGAFWRIDVHCPFFSDDTDAHLPHVGPQVRPNYGTVEETVQTRFRTEISDVFSIPTVFDNVDEPEVPGGGQWIRFSVRLGRALRVERPSLLRTPGVAFAQVFVPYDEGEQPALALADKIVGRFRSVVDQGVVFLTPTLSSVGRQGPWWQLNVQLPFEVDEAA